MIYYKNFFKKKFNLIKKKNKVFCNDIFTFDIETTSIVILNGKKYPAIKYLNFTEKEKKECEFYSFMYIWQFSINDKVYYGRTWEEFREFLEMLETENPEKKIVFVHNLSFEFQFLRGNFRFENVMARNVRHVMKAQLVDYNIEFRCSYMMTNAGLQYLPMLYNLPLEKLTGDLDYSIIRTSDTTLTEKEMKYCENDCLVLYEYIKTELLIYEEIEKIPITFTGHLRRDFKNHIANDFSYKNKVRKSINIDGHIYNLLTEAFAGGYTHSNWIYTDVILENVDSFDFTSSYPYVMITHKFPSKEFKKCNLKKAEYMNSNFAYLLVVDFKNIKSKFYNNFISLSKCRKIKNGRYDNGRIISADEIELVLTDVDFKFILESYSGNYTIMESYFSLYDYLPKQFIDYILEMYVKKTKLKNVEKKEIEYSRIKSQFNSLYGMTVTNTIRDEVIYDNQNGWDMSELSDIDILLKLQSEKTKAFLSFSYGVWVTAHARYNLLKNVLKLDEYIAYCDTDSVKLVEGYDKKVIDDYNNEVFKKIKMVSKNLDIDLKKFSPVDINGKKHTIGLFEKEFSSKKNKEFSYKEFITQGAKKYAYKTFENEVHITVSGVPKKGASALKNDLNNFKDNLVFNYEDIGKNLLIYNDFQNIITVTDYQNHITTINEKTGACLVPTTYELKKSLEYTTTLEELSSKRSKYKGV